MTPDGKGVELVWNFQEKGHYPVYIMDNGKERKISFNYLKLVEKIDQQGIEKKEPPKKLTFGEVLMQID